MIVKINSQNKITLPKILREELKIKSGDKLILDIQDNLLVLIPEPKRYSDYLQGLHREIWEDIDVEAYINKERNAW